MNSYIIEKWLFHNKNNIIINPTLLGTLCYKLSRLNKFNIIKIIFLYKKVRLKIVII
jgi:hypothetical protein